MFEKLNELKNSVLGGALKFEDLEKLIPTEFIKEHTPFASLKELVEKFGADTKGSLEALHTDKFNDFLAQHTSFKSLEDIIEKVKEKF